MKYARALTQVPQTQPVVGQNMVRNNAGGYGFKVEDFERLKKFITIGTEGGTYYVGEQKLTRAEAEATIRALQANPQKCADEIIDVLVNNRAHKRQAALFALALATDPSIVKDEAVRASVFAQLPTVLRTGTDLFTFVDNVATLRGHGGQGLQKALSNWYASKSASDLAYQLMKYQSRGGWSHRDILRIARPGAGKRAKITDPETRALVRWALSGFDSSTDKVDVSTKEGKAQVQALPPRIQAVNELRRDQEAIGVNRVAEFIRTFNLPREVIPTHFLNEQVVWAALIEKMPMLATIRNLGAMSAKGFLSGNIEKAVIARLTDQNAVEKSGVHPFHVLLAARTYRSGRGERGTNTWPVNQNVVKALDITLKASLRNPTPSGKNVHVFIDVSGSMRPVQDQAHVLGYCFAAIEPEAKVLQFDTAGWGSSGGSGGGRLIKGVYDPNITAASDLDTVLRNVRSGGGTDVSLPFQYIQHNKLEKNVDAVVMITDSESWSGSHHTYQLVDAIRAKNPDFKAVEVQLTPGYHKQLRGNANELLICGFDASVYGVVSDFIAD